MFKDLAIVLLITCLIPIAATQNSYKTDSKPEWEQGVLDDTRVTSGSEKLVLDYNNLALKWLNNYTISGSPRDVETDGSYLYMFSTDSKNTDGVVKFDISDRSVEDFISLNQGWQTEMALSENGYLYVGTSTSDPKLRKIDTNTMTEVNNANWPINVEGSGNKINSIDVNSNYNYLVFKTSNQKMYKLDLSDGSEIISNRSVPGISLALRIRDDGYIYAGRWQNLALYEPDFDLVNSYSVPEVPFDFEIGPSGDIYYVTGDAPGDSDPTNDVIGRVSGDLSTTRWETVSAHNDTAARIELRDDGNVVSTGIHSDDKIILTDGESGDTIFSINPSMFGSIMGLKTIGNKIYVGSSVNTTHTGVGEVDFFYPNTGTYVSDTQGPSSSNFWNNLEVSNNLNSQDVEAKVEFTNNPTFNNVQDSVDIDPVGDGVQNFTLNKSYNYARVNFTLTGSQLSTPEIDYFTLYSGNRCVNALGCWLMDEGSGQTVFDYSGNGHHLFRGTSSVSETEDPEWLSGTDCVSGSCLNFTEIEDDETISIQDHIYDMNNFTLRFDIQNRDELSTDWVFVKENQIRVGLSRDEELFASVKSSECGGWCGDSRFGAYPSGFSSHDYFLSGYKIPAGKWKSLRVIWNGTHMSFYQNESFISSITSSKISGYTEMNTEDSSISIGYNPAVPNHAKHSLDNIKILNFTLYPENPIDTQIVAPDESEWQNNDFSVDVDDSGGNIDTCSYRKYFTPGGWGPWQIRSPCPDGDIPVDVDGSGPCSQNGFETCRIQANVTATTGSSAVDYANYSIFRSSISCDEDKLFLCMRFEEGSGQVAYDYSGENNHGSVGRYFRPDSSEPTWITNNAECFDGNCLEFTNSNDQVNISDSPETNFDEFSITGAVKPDIGDPSPDNILNKPNEVQLVASESPNNNLSISIYNNAECGGWCGSEGVSYHSHPFYVSDMTLKTSAWTRFKITWNGTHFSFYDENGLVETGAPNGITTATAAQNTDNNIILGSKGSGPAWLTGYMDEIKIYNESDAGSVPGAIYCTDQEEGIYSQINEDGEKTGRLKNDLERCLEDRNNNYRWFDQDFGDVDGDGVQDTCDVSQNGVRWVSRGQVENPALAPAFTEGVDDDWTEYQENLQDGGQYSENRSRPSASSWGPDESPVPTGIPGNDSIATKGFCAGDDQGEFVVIQDCNTERCETDTSVFATAESPNSCTLSSSVNGFSGSNRSIYDEGEKVDLTFGPTTEEIACFDGQWFDKWPVSFESSSYEALLGGERVISFKLINTEPTESKFELSMSGQMANFASFTGEASQDEITVPPRTAKTLQVRVSAAKETSTPQQLSIMANSLDGDFSGEDTSTIDVFRGSEGETDFRANVPGITFLEIIGLAAASSAYLLLS